MSTPSITSAQVLAELQRHVGRANGVRCARLVQLITNRQQATGVEERTVRAHIADLRTAGHAICGRPDCGYFIAATADELEETCNYLHSRAMSSLSLASAMRKHSMPALTGQATLTTTSKDPQ